MKRPLKEIRLEHGMTQADMAELLGHTTTFYYNIENQKRGVSLKTAEAIADIFGLSVTDINFYARNDTKTVKAS